MNRMTRAERARIGVRGLGRVAAEFEEFAVEIRREYGRLKRLSRDREPDKTCNDPTTDESRFDAADGFLLRECYFLLVRSRSRAGISQAVKRLAKYDLRDDRQPAFEDNYFYWGMLAIVPDFEIRDLRSSSEKLRYAAKHKVEPEYVIGFLLQSGPHKLLRRRAGSSFTDDSFELFRKRRKQLMVGWPRRGEIA